MHKHHSPALWELSVLPMNMHNAMSPTRSWSDLHGGVYFHLQIVCNFPRTLWSLEKDGMCLQLANVVSRVTKLICLTQGWRVAIARSPTCVSLVPGECKSSITWPVRFLLPRNKLFQTLFSTFHFGEKKMTKMVAEKGGGGRGVKLFGEWKLVKASVLWGSLARMVSALKIKCPTR